MYFRSGLALVFLAELSSAFLSFTYLLPESTDDAGRWADDLLEIVSEPMNKTLDRMKKYSSSSANVGKSLLFVASP